MRESTPDILALGREAYRDHEWSTAYSHLLASDLAQPLIQADLEMLAMTAHLVGRDSDSTELWSRAHRDYLERSDSQSAARCAFWLASHSIMVRGDMASSAGWQARGLRLLDNAGLDCAERGYLLMVRAIRCLFEGDYDNAVAGFEHVMGIGERFQDANLTTTCRLGKGQVLMRTGRLAEGLALFDEVLVAVTAGDMMPVFAGLAYCAVIDDCQYNYEVRRARVWTESLDRWSAAQPGLVPYRRQCLVHRAEILRFHGAWMESLTEAAKALTLVSQVPDRLYVGEAWYQQAEVHRLRGEIAAAEEAYRQASRMGRQSNPGFALLRLQQGHEDAAMASLHRELDETEDRRRRAPVLSAYVHVLADAGDIEAAQRAADELSAIADELHTPPMLQAMALQAQGAVELASGDAFSALPHLRAAWKAWFDLEAPYEAGSVRVLLGLCCRDLGDSDSADLEFDAAEQIFVQLGAAPDVERVRALNPVPVAGGGAHSLTDREREVLRLVVAGNTNQAIAIALVISDHTARRHIQNIFAKLGVSSRAAATAVALQEHLI